MGWFDNIIGFFSPSTALRRVQNKAAINVLERAYEAAQRGGKSKSWRGGSLSATSEVRTAGNLLRERSREQARNNPYPRRALRSIPFNTVGSGIIPAIRVDGAGKGSAPRIKKLWADWASSTGCDFDGRKTFYAIQALAMRSMLESGECFVIKRIDRDSIRLQVLEADHLDTLKDGIQLSDGGYIIQGIEFDSAGKRVAYWLYQQHPGDLRVNANFISKRFSADDVIHLFEEERPGQLRGVPLGMSAITRNRDFSEYQTAQLIRQKIAACFSVFITKDMHSALPGDLSATNAPLEKVEPGIIEHLQPGEQIQFASPAPVEGYAEYSTGILHEIAAGYEVPYEVLTGDYSQVNFSSARMARMEYAKYITALQEFVLIPVLCDRVLSWFSMFLRLKGEIRDTATIVASWTCPAMEFIDPSKEIKAMVEKVRGGLMSWQEGVRQLGYDPEEVLQQLIDDAKKFDSAGLLPYTDPRFDIGRQKEIPNGQ